MAVKEEPEPITPRDTEIALFPLNTVLFPGGPLPLRIFEPRYVDLVRRCMRERCAFGVVLILEGAEAGEPARRIAAVGTSARIVDFYQLPDGLLGISCIGGRRFHVRRRRQQDDGLSIAEVEWLEEEPGIDLPEQYRHLGELIRKVLPELGELYAQVPAHFEDASWIGWRLAEILPLSLSDKQYCLELEDPLTRLARLSPLIRRAEE